MRQLEQVRFRPPANLMRWNRKCIRKGNSFEPSLYNFEFHVICWGGVISTLLLLENEVHLSQIHKKFPFSSKNSSGFPQIDINFSQSTRPMAAPGAPSPPAPPGGAPPGSPQLGAHAAPTWSGLTWGDLKKSLICWEETNQVQLSWFQPTLNGIAMWLQLFGSIQQLGPFTC